MDLPTQHYTVMARRFRPQTFEDVVGQEHVGQSLKNAIRGGRVAHAYLFTGARGVGKTSTARIFAKALNCPHVTNGVPCNQCEVCQSIGAGSDVDVLEIDGASNRGIDDIRQLRANVNVRSMRSPYKVYIIDEVHMLTKEAFNALLKTLEEPPQNVKFVFCTTEPNKVPETILSRCQRFDFGTIAADSIMGRLKQIAEAEGRIVSDEALELVARRAAGSMRDSQSLFDQLLAFGSDQVDVADVHLLLGTAPDDRIALFFDALIARQHAHVLTLLDEALLQGTQLGILSDQCLGYLRDLLVVAVGAEKVSLSSVGSAFRPRLAEQAQQWGLTNMTMAMQILAEAKARMQRVNYSRALFELALVRIASLADLDQIALLVATLGSDGAPATNRPSARPSAPAARHLIPNPATVKPTTSSVPSLPKHETRPATTTDSAPAAQTEPQHPGTTQDSAGNTVIKLSPETLGEFWERFLTEIPDMMRNHLANSESRAISGPNGIELTFHRSYLFSKTYCERAETLQKMQQVALKVCGEKISFRYKLEGSAPPAPAKEDQQQSVTSSNKKVSVVHADPFVQSAVEIFGGQVVEVTQVLSSPVGETEQDPE